MNAIREAWDALHEETGGVTPLVERLVRAYGLAVLDAALALPQQRDRQGTILPGPAEALRAEIKELGKES